MILRNDVSHYSKAPPDRVGIAKIGHGDGRVSKGPFPKRDIIQFTNWNATLDLYEKFYRPLYGACRRLKRLDG